MSDKPEALLKATLTDGVLSVSFVNPDYCPPELVEAVDEYMEMANMFVNRVKEALKDES